MNTNQKFLMIVHGHFQFGENNNGIVANNANPSVFREESAIT